VEESIIAKQVADLRDFKGDYPHQNV